MLAAYGGNKAALEHLTRCAAYDLQDFGVAVNALAPSRPVASPGLASVAPDLEAQDPAGFAEATIRLALADPTVCTGRLLYHEDVLHPENGQRGWLG